MTIFPRFPCPRCGRSIAALPDSNGRRHHYAYLRAHRALDGQPCLAWHTGALATVLA